MKQMKSRAARFVVATIAFAVLPALSHAQVAQQATSVIDDLLTRAENSLNDLQYAQAISFAKQVIDLGDRVPADKQERALFIVAAANYPEGEPTAQHRDVALATLKQMVRVKFDLTIPQALRWAGLDSVLTEAKATTFGLAASATPQQEVIGPAGRGEVTARASRPATFVLTIRALNGPVVMQVADSGGASQSTLRFQTMVNDRPAFTSGDYEMTVTAIDRVSRDSVNYRFTAAITAPALTFATVPVAVDSTRFISERTKRYGVKGIIVGGLVAGSMFTFSSLMHGDTTLKSQVGADSKGMGVAALSGLAVIIASYADKGRSIPTAIAANQQLRDDFATSIRNAQAENASRIANYKTVLVITPGGR